MSETAFKVGDKVRVVESEWDVDVDDGDVVYLGHFGTVVEVIVYDSDPPVAIIAFDEIPLAYFYFDELELVTDVQP